MIEAILMPNSDEVFFAEHRDRKARIRKPLHEREFEVEFRSLGDHELDRRRVIVVKVKPKGVPGQPLLPIPFLAFGDETIADNDATLLPIIDGIMQDAAMRYGIKPRRR